MQCLICNKIIQDTFMSLLRKTNNICYECFNGFKRRNINLYINGVECFVLYYYDDFFKHLLYRYKGCYDFVLKDCFLIDNIKYLKRKYKGYSVVLAPSNKDSEEKRGFNHLEEIFKKLDLPIIKCFRKSKKWKQSDKKFNERKEIQKVIKIDKTLLKGIKKVLIVDDVLTSGSTIQTMIRQIPTNIDKKVLVLSSNCQFLANDFV